MSNSPPIFVINLDRSVERLALCRSRLSSIGFSFERITAVNGAELSSKELNEHYSPVKNLKDYYKKLTLGEIGCYLSHRKAWQKIVDENIKYAIILEDDFSVEGDLHKTINALNNIPFEWDYIKLATYKSRTRHIAYKQKASDMDLVVFDKAMAGTCAQAVSLKGAKKMLLNSSSFGRPIDTDIQHWWEKNIELMALLPYAFAPDLDLESELAKIQPKTTKVKQYFWKRKWQQLTFFYKNRKERNKLILKIKN